MSFLNPTGVTTLWSRMMNYLTGSHVKTSVVSGATDVDGALTKLQTKTGTATLTTTAKNLSGAVNELNSGIGDLNDTGLGEPTLSKSVNRASKILQPKSIGEYGATAGYDALSEPWNLTFFETSTGDSTNPTTEGSWRIIQTGDTNYGSQLAFQVNSIGIYQRNKLAGTWGAWTKL